MAKITDEQWHAAREMYENDPNAGYGTIATQVLDCSRSLVAKRAAKERWQKRDGVVPAAKKGAGVSAPKFTENTGASETRSAATHTDGAESSGQIGDVYRAPALLAPKPAVGGVGNDLATPRHESQAFRIAEPPADLGIIERLDWVRREFNVLEQKMGDRHETERRALQNEFAIELTKGVRTDRGPALRLKALTEALGARQSMQKAALEEYRENRLKEYAGVYSSSLIIVAVPVPCYSLMEPNNPAAIACRLRDVAGFYAAEADKAAAAADADDANWRDVPEQAAPGEPVTVDVDAREVGAGDASGTVYAPRQ